MVCMCRRSMRGLAPLFLLLNVAVLAMGEMIQDGTSIPSFLPRKDQRCIVNAEESAIHSQALPPSLRKALVPAIGKTQVDILSRRGGKQQKGTIPALHNKPTPAVPIRTAAAPGMDPHKAYVSALRKTALAISAAVAFGAGLWFVKGQQSSMEFFAGYLIEESLSVDNIFVFIMLFEYFKVPLEYQSRALTWGIIGAVVMRGVMILVGVAAIHKFKWVVLMFAAILLGSAAKLLVGHDEHENLSDNVMLKLASKLVPAVDTYDGDRFFTKINGKRFATPLFMCLICIELSDFVFAVDSIPAVLGVSKDPLIVYSSNIFAIMALRSLYTLVATAVNTLEYIKPSVALVLAFVGIKMGLEFFHIEVPISASLGVVMGILGSGIGLSILKRNYVQRKRLAGLGARGA